MHPYTEEVAALATVLDDPARSLIGDPRQQVYKVSLISTDMREAMQYARKLAWLGIIPSTNLEHDTAGSPYKAHVNVWGVAELRTLLEAVKPILSTPRRKALEDLVAARSPVPDELRARIISAHHERGLNLNQIARKLNELDIVAGMGGKCWTPQKVKKVVKSVAVKEPWVSPPYA